MLLGHVTLVRFCAGGSTPAPRVVTPDAAVTALEDRLIKTQRSSAAGLAAQMAKTNIQAPPLQARGQPVTLWSNYFNVTFKPMVLYKYTFEFVQAASREVKGRKLYFAVRELLATLKAADKTLVLATEYKSQLVSLQKLKLAENPVRFRLAVETSGDKWDVIEATIHGPTEAPLDALLKYYPDVVDALNVILGHGPRSKLHDISAVGSARFFPFGKDEAATNLFQDFHQLIAARGFFQSARLGTGRLLLNANVSHGVFPKLMPTWAALPLSRGSLRCKLRHPRHFPGMHMYIVIHWVNGEGREINGQVLPRVPSLNPVAGEAAD
ncbi:argonaute linker 1 domain-containing protein [Hirsutella rhossiliensis]|uniref:Argonaute linker 1 domain-containing protein n=1 Tax=Hirsutella rhossiliensis TaxID=111463 RepID=A0A9P8SD64_9HYPO|nr:argonaute linker 1 domain-containing protein [Hirsutella rhossiliensis]KAH0957619.1 argonaute linker 1 domain-containing protein [Hirsutella rhossiliensis]